MNTHGTSPAWFHGFIFISQPWGVSKKLYNVSRLILNDKLDNDQAAQWLAT